MFLLQVVEVLKKEFRRVLWQSPGLSSFSSWISKMRPWWPYLKEILKCCQKICLLHQYFSIGIHIWIIVFIGDYEYCPGGPKFMLPPSSTKWNIEPPTFIFWDNIQHLSAFNVSYFDIKHQVIVFFDQGQKLKYLFISMWFGCYWNVESIMVLDNVGTKH